MIAKVTLAGATLNIPSKISTSAIALTVRDTKAYSRRQMTWFRRDSEVRWCDPASVDPVAFAAAALGQTA